MAQTYQMNHNPQGTIYSLLTVESDGRMTMTFHGTDREISHVVTENADGWLCYPGGMFPGLESGKWNKTDDRRCKMEDGRCKMDDVVETADCADSTDNQPEVIEEATDYTNYTNSDPVIVRSALPLCSAKNPEPSDIGHQSSATLKAAGMVAAATVALLVIYETGLLIPLGLIGLATSGLLK